MDLNQVHCDLLTKENIHLVYEALGNLSESDELDIDAERLERFLEYPHNLAFIATYDNTVCGLIYGYSLMSLTSNPQLFIYSVDVLYRYQNNGIGTKLFQYVVDYSAKHGYSECFVITDKGNKRACRIYEKTGGKSDFEDEIVYVFKNN